HAFGAFRIARPDAAGQPVDGVIGDPYRVVFVLVRDDRKHRAEDLFLRDGHLVVDVGEDGRADEIARRDPFGHFGAAGNELSAFFTAFLDVVDASFALGG